MLLIIFDEMMPSYLMPALLHNSHLTKFSNYFILVNQRLVDRLPIIPNSLTVMVSRPASMFGASRFLNMTPYYHRISLKSERPFLYFIILLAHRKDFPLYLHHILPMVLYTHEIWANNLNNVPSSRALWMNIISTLFSTMTPYVYIRNSFTSLFEKFFKDSVPSIPYVSNIDFENESIFSTENPPNPQECGMLFNFGDEITAENPPNYDWRNEVSGHKLTIIPTANPIHIIKDAQIMNSRSNKGNLSLLGSTKVDVYVVEEEPEVHSSPIVSVGVYHLFLFAFYQSNKF